MNKKTIEQVMSFNYFGAVTSSDRNLYEEEPIQANKGARISGTLCDFVWRIKFVSTKNEAGIFRTTPTVGPVLTYAAQTRADYRKTKNLPRTTQNENLKIIVEAMLWGRKRRSDTSVEYDGMEWSKPDQ